jgi:hypothetical protein
VEGKMNKMFIAGMLCGKLLIVEKEIEKETDKLIILKSGRRINKRKLESFYNGEAYSVSKKTAVEIVMTQAVKEVETAGMRLKEAEKKLAEVVKEFEKNLKESE